MFGIDGSELLVIAVIALVVIGPKDLPRVMRVVGQWVGKARGMASHFRSGIDEVIRHAELEEMEKRWAAENARIMAEHPPSDYAADQMMVDDRNSTHRVDDPSAGDDKADEPREVAKTEDPKPA